MNIRLLNQRDVSSFRALRSEAVREAPAAFTESFEEITKRSEADCAYQLQSHGKGDFVLGAFDNNTHLVGMVGFYRAVHDKQSHKGTLWGMYVAPKERERGVGRALMTAAIEHAKKLPGIVYLTLCVTASNKAAIRFYETTGFQVCGTERQALCIDGVYFDEMMMQLMFKAKPKLQKLLNEPGMLG
jgi:ribosomal protein S18 acetylase RimI-like enzyme